jgi:hypothetical protein
MGPVVIAARNACSTDIGDKERGFNSLDFRGLRDDPFFR